MSQQNELQRLLPRHYTILDLVLGGNGPKEIAQALDMTPQAISLITNSPIFQSEVARRRSNIEKKTDDMLAATPARAKSMIDEAAVNAAQTQIDLLSDPDSAIKLRASQHLLDRVFGDAKEQNKAGVVVMNVEQIQILQMALSETKEDFK